jgi:hypothetical protein
MNFAQNRAVFIGCLRFSNKPLAMMMWMLSFFAKSNASIAALRLR